MGPRVEFALKPATLRVVVGYIGSVKNGVLNNDVFLGFGLVCRLLEMCCVFGCNSVSILFRTETCHIHQCVFFVITTAKI